MNIVTEHSIYTVDYYKLLGQLIDDYIKHNYGNDPIMISVSVAFAAGMDYQAIRDEQNLFFNGPSAFAADSYLGMPFQVDWLQTDDIVLT